MRKSQVLVFVAMAVSACRSPKAPGGSVQVTTSLDPRRQLSTLSDSEAQAYCADINVYLQSQLAANQRQIGDCAATAESSSLGASGDKQAACQASYDQCLQGPVPANTVDCTQFTMNIKSCPATVGDYDKCLSAEAALVVQFAGEGRTICDRLAGGGSSSTVGSPPAECLALPAGCFSSSSSGASGAARGDGA